MLLIRALLCATNLPGVFSLQPLTAQAPPGPSDISTFRVATRLVFLDVTVT
jgi:hypothetical protein